MGTTNLRRVRLPYLSTSAESANFHDIVVLAYHGVSDHWPAETTVTPQRLEEQLVSLVRAGYRGATLRDALTAPRSPKVLVVTFDDAHRSVYELARPILDRLGLPGTVFVPTLYPDSGSPMAWPGYAQWADGFADELACMSWDELARLVRIGWEIGSHTRSHPRLTQLDRAELADELLQSRLECEARLGEQCLSLAYPYSDYDGRVAEAAGEAGYRFAVTIPRAAAPALPLQWPRVGVYNRDSAVTLRRRISVRGPVAAALVRAAFRRRISRGSATRA